MLQTMENKKINKYDILVIVIRERILKHRFEIITRFS